MLTKEEKRKRVADRTRKYYYNRWSSPEDRKQYERERKRAYRASIKELRKEGTIIKAD